MTSIGETLRRERMKRSLDLKTVSSELKISSRFLEAIEGEAFDKLPGGMFTKSFVRQYAKYLGLDEDDLVAELDRVLEPAVPLAPARGGAPIEVPRVEEWQVMNDRFSWSGSLPALAMVVVVMLVCSGVYSWWQRSRTSASAAPQTALATETAQAQPPAPAPVQPQPQPEAPPVATPPTTAPAAEPTPAQPQAQAQAQPPAATQASEPGSEAAPAPKPRQDTGSADRPTAETAPAAATTNPAPPPLPPGGGPVRVELTASEPVWVLAQADGKYSFSGTLEANQTRTVEASGKVILRLGNAGGVNITLNGKPIGTVGAKGQVKTIQLTSGGWTAAAPKPSLPVDDIL